MTSASDFRLVRPITIVDATLTSSTVPELAVTEYSSGTTYAVGDIRGVTAGTAQIVYQSLQAANVGHAPATSPLWWKVLGTVYAAYAAGTSYNKGDIVSSISANVHQLYESLVAANAGNALTDKTKWLPLGATNRWKMFDKAVNSQTRAPESFQFVITTSEIVNTLSLLNVEGASVTIAQGMSGYARTKNLVSHNVLNWYDFYYETPIRAGDVVFDDIPPFPGAPLTVTISNPGSEAACGLCAIGKSRTIGTTLWELTGGILSYSGTTTDQFGNTTLLKRTNAKRLNVEVKIPSGFESEAHRLLSAYMDTELVVIAASGHSMGIIYGYLGQWEVPLSIEGKNAPIEIRGLI